MVGFTADMFAAEGRDGVLSLSLNHGFPWADVPNAGAKMLSVRVMRDAWSAQRSCSGYDLPQDTPLANLWMVGDAVKDYGDGGTQACADTGRTAAQRALAWLARPVLA